MIYVYCSTGDQLWAREKEPVDSPAAVRAMLEWMSQTYDVKRMYWRGGIEELWDRNMKFGKETPLQYDWAIPWKRHTFQLGTNQAVIEAAKKLDMEVFLYGSLFDYGVQPDIGIIGPYLFEDYARIEHPEWCMKDRWGERSCPGPIEFAFPDARRYAVDRFVNYATERGFDGINFYTYVENCGIRYKEEFGFAEPVVQAFREYYPDADLRKDRLNEKQKRIWYVCRGRFVTDFIRELHAELAVRNKKLSIILDAGNPDYVQSWWSKEHPGTGMIHLDWRRWIAEGIVDELWVQLGALDNQLHTLDQLLIACEGTKVKLTVRTPKPFDSVWAPYIAKGVTPVAVITSPVNGIERLIREKTELPHLQDGDWRYRAQALADMSHGQIEADPEAAADLAADAHLLVRQRAMRALKAIGTTSRLPAIEAGLHDSENCVRVAAADALGKVNNGDTALKLLQAIERDRTFLMKQACIDSLAAMGKQSGDAVISGLRSGHAAVREVCVRTLRKLGEQGLSSPYPHLLASLRDKGEDELVRYWAIDSLEGLTVAGRLDVESREELVAELAALTDHEPSAVVQLKAVKAVARLAEANLLGTSVDMVPIVSRLFREYGDGCTRTDAAFGWRIAGNALLALGERGRAALDKMRVQTDDRWLAWLAYEVVYLPHREPRLELIEEERAIAEHRQYAPPFPGYRTW